MGKPAARLGDLTSHGGTVVLGFPMVLIGGMPAARIGDMHVCPMVTPGTPPIPHVGGPVTLGSPMVLIGGMPAARVGDMAVCVGPPDTIAIGCFTVLIGEGGSGSGSGGGAASSAAASAAAGAANAVWGNVESSTKEKNWIEFAFQDKAGNPVSGTKYKLTDTNKKESSGVIKPDGRIIRDGIPEGECKVELIDLYSANWSVKKAKVGDKVKLNVKSMGIKNGEKVEFNVFVKDIKFADHLLKRIEAKIDNDKAEADWELKVDEDFIKVADAKKKTGYSQPYFYFDAFCGGLTAKSPLLYYEDWIEVQFKDSKGKVIADKQYKMILSTGEIKEGKLDSGGNTKIENIPPGTIDLTFKD